MPLDVLASRMVVPRDMPHTPFDPASLHPDYDSVTAMDQRITVPAAMPVVEFEAKGPVAAYELPDVLEPDVLNTGEANLMRGADRERPPPIGTGSRASVRSPRTSF